VSGIQLENYDFLSPDEREKMRRFLSFPEEFPKEFKDWLIEYINVGATVQKYQVSGLANQTPHFAQVLTSEDCSFSTPYKDLATVGPSLDNLGKGTYLITYGAQCAHGESGSIPGLSVSINGGTASAVDGIYGYMSSVNGNMTHSRSLLKDLDLPSNTIKVQYNRTGSGSTVATFSNRWLIAIRVGTL
jgi:hypothetical protein